MSYNLGNCAAVQVSVRRTLGIRHSRASHPNGVGGMGRQMSRPQRDSIPEGVIERLSVYLNCLMQLRSQGADTCSSETLGSYAQINPAQIRRDFTYFGTFGKKGVGYRIEELITEIQHILHSDEPHRIVLVGAGNLGSAIASYDGLPKHGFHLAAIFDSDKSKVGSHVGHLEVFDVKNMPDVIRNAGIHIGVIAVPPHASQGVADLMVEGGVKVILNYTPVMISVPDGVRLHNTDPVKQLLHTLYYISSEGQRAKAAK